MASVVMAAALGLSGLGAAAASDARSSEPVDEYGLTAEEQAWIDVPEGAEVEKYETPSGDVAITVSSVMDVDDPRNQPVSEASVTVAADGTVTVVEPLAAGCTRTSSISRPTIVNRRYPVSASLSLSTGCASVSFSAEGWAPDSISEKLMLSAGGVVSPGNTTTVSTSMACGENFRYWRNFNRTYGGAIQAESARVWLKC